MSSQFDLAKDGFEIVKANDSQLIDFQIFGERCSGTNFLEELLPLNFALSSFRNYGWKHGFPNMSAIAPDSLIVAVFREPLSWLTSMYRKPWHTTEELQKAAFSKFIRMEWKSVVDKRNYFRRYEADGRGEDCVGQLLQLDRHPVTGAAFKNILRLRSSKAAGHLGFRRRECNCVLVRYEMAASRTEDLLDAIATAFNLPRKLPFRQVARHFGGGFRPKSKARAAIIDGLSEADRNYIAAELDWDIETSLGYGNCRPHSNDS